MRVLHICPGYFDAPLYDKLFMALRAIGVVNEIFVFKNRRISNFDTKPYKLFLLDREFSRLDRFIYFGKQHKIYKSITKDFTLSEFGMTHAHTLFSAGYASFSLFKKLSLPYTVAVRSTDFVFFKYMFHLRWLGVRIMINAQKIVFLSPAYRDYILERYVPSKYKQMV